MTSRRRLSTRDRVRERPILFSGPMVRAILDGRKSQTRRVMKPQPAEFTPNIIDIDPPTKDETGAWGQWETKWSNWTLDSRGEPLDEIWRPLRLPYAPGDRLWVRETWAHDAPHKGTCRAAYEDALAGSIGYGPYYRATEIAPETLRWRPSIFMPRWASRITLTVTDVRVQKVQDISTDDCLAEGIEAKLVLQDGLALTAKAAFRNLWNSLNEKRGYGWDANPWVVALTFERTDAS